MRYRVFFLLTFATVCAASTAAAVPQTGSGGGRAATVRTRCPRSSCAMSGDSALRARQEALFYRIDSLRWQSENVRLTDVERQRIAAEIASSVIELQASIDEAIRSHAAERTTVEGRVPSRVMAGPRIAIAMPECRTPGYLGITFDGLNEDYCKGSERMIRFYKYPRIELVAQSSPAEQAGILKGDTLLSLAGTDVTEGEISLTKLLVPDARVAMRVRRDGDAKDLTVIIREAPAYYILRSAPLPSMPQRSPTPQVPVRVRTVEPQQPAIAFSWSYGDGLAGARVETITEGLGAALGFKDGVLVVSARPGSPAHRSGLRDGDVIQKASGTPIANVRMLREILSSGNGDDGVKLLVFRERKQRELTLHW